MLLITQINVLSQFSVAIRPILNESRLCSKLVYQKSIFSCIVGVGGGVWGGIGGGVDSN